MDRGINGKVQNERHRMGYCAKIYEQIRKEWIIPPGDEGKYVGSWIWVGGNRWCGRWWLNRRGVDERHLGRRVHGREDSVIFRGRTQQPTTAFANIAQFFGGKDSPAQLNILDVDVVFKGPLAFFDEFFSPAKTAFETLVHLLTVR
jgi:hypothetical protein